MTAGYRIVIPARMASERLPGKPLIDIAGRPLIEHVFRRASESAAQAVVIATDSPEIAEAATAFGAEAVMTSPDHASGSDRIAECLDALDWPEETVVVNLQGDEPLMPPACLDQAAGLLDSRADADVASLYWPIDDPVAAEDSNVVKVVVDGSGLALYFSRSLIPHPRGLEVAAAIENHACWNRHIGLYAYRTGALRAFAALQPGPLERLEKLEQLRFMESGRRIVMERACEFIPEGVDTARDLERARSLLESGR